MVRSNQFPIANYRDFWPYYLRAHAKAETRAIHYFGTFLALTSLAAVIATGALRLLPLVLVAGYGPAWIGHFFIEHNRPATFSYRFRSLISDFRMAFAGATGRLGPELAKAGIDSR